jgi:hypothetical protein
MGPNRFLAGLVAVNAAVGAISAARTAVAKQQGDAILGSVMSWPLIATFAASMALFIVAAALCRRAGVAAGTNFFRRGPA